MRATALVSRAVKTVSPESITDVPAEVLATDLDRRPPGRARSRLEHGTFVVLVVGLLIAVVLGLALERVHRNNESRLLLQRTREAAAVLTAALPGIQTPLGSAAELVEVTGIADPTGFQQLIGPFVVDGRPYVSVSVWRLGDDPLAPVEVIGADPVLATRPQTEIRALFDEAASVDGLLLKGLLDEAEPRLGYAMTANIESPTYVVYAEAALPPNRTSLVRSGDAFAGLRNAIYLGAEADPAQLLTASTPDLPLPQPTPRRGHRVRRLTAAHRDVARRRVGRRAAWRGSRGSSVWRC